MGTQASSKLCGFLCEPIHAAVDFLGKLPTETVTVGGTSIAALGGVIAAPALPIAGALLITAKFLHDYQSGKNQQEQFASLKNDLFQIRTNEDFCAKVIADFENEELNLEDLDFHAHEALNPLLSIYRQNEVSKEELSAAKESLRTLATNLDAGFEDLSKQIANSTSELNQHLHLFEEIISNQLQETHRAQSEQASIIQSSIHDLAVQIRSNQEALEEGQTDTLELAQKTVDSLQQLLHQRKETLSELTQHLAPFFQDAKDHSTKLASDVIHPLLDRRDYVADSGEELDLRNLRYDRQWLTFLGRDRELATLWDWLNDSPSFSWTLVHGPGGSGKSRLAHNLVLQAHAAGWEAGFLTEANLWLNKNYQNWKPSRHTLIVIDYPTLYSENLPKALRRLHETFQQADGYRIRLLLADRPGVLPTLFPSTLENAADHPCEAIRSSRHSFQSESVNHSPSLTGSLFQEDDFMALGMLPPRDWIEVFLRIYAAHGKELPPGFIDKEFIHKIFKATLGLPLYLQLAAEILVRREDPDLTTLEPFELLDAFLAREISDSNSRWEKLTNTPFSSPEHEQLRAFIGVLTLLRGADFNDQKTVALFTSLFQSQQPKVNLPQLRDQARAILGGNTSPQELPGLEPDLLGGRFLLLGGLPSSIIAKQDPLAPQEDHPTPFDAASWLPTLLSHAPETVFQTIHLLLKDFIAEPAIQTWLPKLATAAVELDLKRDSHAEVHLQISLILQHHAQHGLCEPLLRRELEHFQIADGSDHPNVAIRLNNLASLLKETNRHKEAEPLMERALQIDEQSFGPNHPTLAVDLNNLASLLQETNRHKEAEPLSRRHLLILLKSTRETGHPHPNLRVGFGNYFSILHEMKFSESELAEKIVTLGPEAEWPQEEWKNFIAQISANGKQS